VRLLSSGVTAARAVAAEACEVIAVRFSHELAGGTKAAVVAGCWKGAAAPAIAAEVCELIASGFLHVHTCGAQAGVAAPVIKGWS